MFGFIDRQARSVGAQRLPAVIVEASLDAQSNVGARQAVGLALVALGQRLAGEMPAGQTTHADGDCA